MNDLGTLPLEHHRSRAVAYDPPMVPPEASTAIPTAPSDAAGPPRTDAPAEHFDAVIIGSGPGGLTTAACLASAGKRVLVLERHDVAGGNTQVFRRHHGNDWYEFDVGVHYLGECGPGDIFTSVFSSLGIGDRLTFRPLDPDGFDTLLFPDFTFRVPASWEEYEARLIKQFPADAEGISNTLGVLRTVAQQSRMIFGEAREVYEEWATRPMAELYAESELSPQACAVLNHWSGLYAGPPSRSAVLMHAGMINHYMAGAYYPEGGGQMIAARLIQAIEACGGEVRTLSPVDHITLDQTGPAPRAVGVRLDDGTEISAPIVVSNADYLRTVNDLVGRENFSEAVTRWADEAQMTLGLICVYVVVDINLDGPNTNYFVIPNYDSEGLYETLDDGALPEEGIPFAYLALASRKDPHNPELCPPGHTNFQIMTLAPRGYQYWGLDAGPAEGGKYRRSESYRERKNDLTERLLDAAESVLGPFRDNIVHLETATPLSHERYTHSTGGTSYGFEHSPQQIGKRRPHYRTEIDGLWLVGANSVSGHGIAGAVSGGVFCAGAILDRPLIAEMVMGQQLIDPSSIPSDPPDFDALEYSRGAALRAKRADRVATLRAVRRSAAAQHPQP